MLSSLSSMAILTKVKAMQGRMLTMTDYEQLMHKNSVPACAAFLKAQPAYASVLRDVQETQIHRGALEALLNKAMFEQFKRLERYAGRQNRFFRDYQVTMLEIRCIINCIRLFGSENQNEFMQTVPGYIVGELTFDVLALGNVHNFSELLPALAGTPYPKVLEGLRLRDANPTSLPVIEHALYEYYYAHAHRLIDGNFSGKTARELHTIFYAQAQLFNIAAVFRLKRYFGGNPAEIEQILLRYPGPLPRRVMDQLVKAPGDEAMLDLLARTKYGKFFGRDRFSFIEYGTGEIRYHLARKYLTFSQHPATVFVAFLLLREIEIENLTNIIEGVRYQLDLSQIRPLLIHGGA